VRDLLLGLRPKDFDVATEASPEQIRALFRRSRLIGRRFKLAHVRFGREVVEVATFRGDPGHDQHPERVSVEGRILRDNVYGTLEQDAWRRDFSINSLYYGVEDFALIDYTGGMADLKARRLRLIGDPEVRYREDPVRTLRAVRFMAKLGFELDPETAYPLTECAALLENIPPARLFDEVLKLLHGGYALAVFELLRKYGIFERLFPEAGVCMDDDPRALALARSALANTDTRIAQRMPVTPAFLFAALLWGPLQRDIAGLRAQGLSELQAYEVAGGDVIARAIEYVALPRRFALVAREIWGMQPRLTQDRGKRSARLLDRGRFRAAYDFLALRAEAGEAVREHVDRWTRAQHAHRGESVAAPEAPAPAPRRRRRQRRRKPEQAEQTS